MLKKQDYINIFNEKLSIGLAEKIVDFIYYKFTDKEELYNAVRHYPDNINIYGDCKYWDVSTITDMSFMFYNSKNSKENTFVDIINNIKSNFNQNISTDIVFKTDSQGKTTTKIMKTTTNKINLKKNKKKANKKKIKMDLMVIMTLMIIL